MTEDERKQRIREQNKLKYQKNKEKLLEGCRIWQRQNPEKVAEYHRRYYEKRRNDDDWREKRRKYQNAYYERNQDRLRQYGRDYYYKNREKMLEYQRRWRQENKEKMLERQRRRREENRQGVQRRAEVFKTRWMELWERAPASVMGRLADLLGKRKGAT